MDIRRYKENEITDLWNLFFDTIHKINIRDYTKEQIEAWAPSNFDKSIWKQKITGIDPYVAVIDSKIVGYGDIQSDGLIDHFFCHHEFQRKGIGSQLYSCLEEMAKKKDIAGVSAVVSITAQPFFRSMGFEIVHEQTLSLRGQKLKKYKMSKRLTNG